MHDAIAARLELAQQLRQAERGRGLDVVQQQDALALGFEPLEHAPDDLARIDRRQSSAMKSTLQAMTCFDRR